ncbi:MULTISPECIES: hypothetical protein [Rhodococcus]|jgi:hypothetical protein|uniref:hypothetical protein n=1 Tax=Rhodococcus TaxID=1827 RepID=UPI00117B87CE|nr:MULTISPECIES: hypothetical protein [Rhodococcus]MBP1161590.1 hypothetical protein [Rhodococcus sp. PvR099]
MHNTSHVPDATRLARDGFCVMRSELPEDLRAALIADADRHTFTTPHAHVGGAFAMTSLEHQDRAPSRASGWIGDAASAVGLGPFAPNEASYQRYLPGGNGIPPHRDQRYYASYIAIVTLQGTATFAIHASRNHRDVIEQWTTHPGEVIFLRGWQPGQPHDPRPYHRIDPPDDVPRLMFQLRHNLAASTPPSPLLAELTDTEVLQSAELAATRPAQRT